jgi:tRNA (cmo5U34)-methyltransferase
MAESDSDGGKDRVYAQPRAHVGDFTFDDQVAAVFPDMIRRSVPGYGAIIGMIGLLAEQHAQPHSRLYDLGCSLGAAAAAMRARVGQEGCELVAVDNAPAMAERAREALRATPGMPVTVQCADVRDVAVENASVVVLNFTLQFLPPSDRLALLRRIRHGMRPDAVLVLSEKIAGADPDQDRLLTELHHAFKRANGYSELEISQKRSALERVLIPETIAAHQQRLAAAGFSRSDVWFQCFNFVSLVARA